MHQIQHLLILLPFTMQFLLPALFGSIALIPKSKCVSGHIQ